MTRTAFLIVLLMAATMSQADERVSMTIDSFISIKESTATALIDDKYPITMGLSLEEIRCYDNVGFVSGWYVYDKYQKKIPLIGLYHDGFLDLFQFPPDRHVALMQALHNKTLEPEEFENAQGYLERIEVTHPWVGPDGRVTESVASWSHGDKTLGITEFRWIGNFAPQNNVELVIKNGKYPERRLDMLQAVGLAGEYRLTNGSMLCAHVTLSVNEVAETKAGWNLLLEFARESRRCQGDSSGYFSMQLDHKYQVVDSNGYITYQCDKRGTQPDDSLDGPGARGQRYLVTEGQYDSSENPRVIGSFFIKDAAITIDRPWPEMTP